jgi:glutamate dehydrogenase
MRSEDSDGARNDVLDRAAAALTAAGGGGGAGPCGAAGDVAAYLRAYYRHVATDDLASFGPERIAAVAACHAELAARRPQGRALVRVRDIGGDPDGRASGAGASGTSAPTADGSSVSSAGGASGGCAAMAAFGPVRTVVDIVTDDMPFLVDSVTMELNRHQANIDLILHPRLLVHRDVTGALDGVSGCVGSGESRDAPGETAESWMHIEISGFGDRVPPAGLTGDLRRVLDDVRVAVEDQPRMRALSAALAADLAAGNGNGDREAAELLDWLARGHFIFLGHREYDLIQRDGGAQGTLPAQTFAMPPGATAPPSPPAVRTGRRESTTGPYSLAGRRHRLTQRAVPGTGLGILRHDQQGPDSLPAPPSAPPGDGGATAAAKDERRLVLAKASARSTVYRSKYLDYVAVRRLGSDGRVTGEHRFLGLYAHAAFTEPVARIPVLRRKLADVLAAAGVTPDSHDGSDLVEILESYPREELFQIPSGQLIPIALGVLRLRERKQTRLFLRRDFYGRYMSCLVYLPRDRYTTAVRLRAQEILRRALDGVSVDYSAMVGESALARLHIVVHGAPGRPLPDVDARALERELACAVRSWDEELEEESVRALGADRAHALLDRFAAAVPETYKADVRPAEAVGDLTRVLSLRESGTPFAVRLRSGSGADGVDWRLRVYRLGSPITLSDVLPQLQHMGLDVVDEHPYGFAGSAAASPFWIYDLGLRRGKDPEDPGGGEMGGTAQGTARPGTPAATDPASRELFEDALTALWRGDVEDDGFNALVLDAGLTWRDVVVLRAYARYLRQTGISFSQDYIQRALRSNPGVTRLLVRLFASMFDPARQVGEAERSEAIAEEIRGELDEVASLDHDRILRSYLALIEATLRTSHYRGVRDPQAPPAPYLVIKLDPSRVPGLPEPRPAFEIFVYSPRMEGVHLRFGRVARGGIRASDRLEDFRTEILGLVKAQEVKNAVIVPSGAKGGFVCKKLPRSADREAIAAEVLRCYKMFISGMLDVTDNFRGGQVQPPRDVVRRDGDDPYLVVAADKGTATFSDVANEIARSYGFWLGDAFASGGSEGYDHKKMGITARGAWESVKCHFATLGMDPERDEFTAAGIGDMSGDVFGNGMLLSRTIKLIAAFDHRHVFIDPDPDPAASFAERRRLFTMERSTWADYDPAVISAGGGVWPRSAKSVPVSPQARVALGIDGPASALSPDELISAILAAPVDLLWNGGIGTYVKATGQSHADAGDRSNDAVRIDASRLRAKVIAEGGNLGLTQEARIEYSLAGGLVNTDFIDNSAGVDTSDHEVNIKILLDGAVRDGEIGRDDRNSLLHEMTGEVASLVLRHNYHQNMALATACAQAPQMLHVHARYLRALERQGRLHRGTDAVPGEKEIAERRSAGRGLTRPELALLLAHTKIAAAGEVLASGLPDDPYLRRELTVYFPAPLRARHAGRMMSHPLHREIITTSVVNEMVDTSGTTFAFRLNEETGSSVTDITMAWLVARQVFGMREFWRQVTELGGRVDVATQIALLLEGRKLVERACRWLLYNRRPPFDIAGCVDFFTGGVDVIRSGLPKLLAGSDADSFGERHDWFTGHGVPPGLASTAAGMVPSYSAFDIVEIAAASGRSIEETAEVYFDLADRLQITRLRDRITALPRDDRWSGMARAALRDDLYAAHAALTRDVLGVSGPGTPEERLAAWTRQNEAAVARAARTLGEIWESERFTFTTLSVALRAVRALVTSSSLPH